MLSIKFLGLILIATGVIGSILIETEISKYDVVTVYVSPSDPNDIHQSFDAIQCPPNLFRFESLTFSIVAIGVTLLIFSLFNQNNESETHQIKLN